MMVKPIPLADARPARLNAPLGPLLAGARARGVADGLEWLGLAAILIDDRGEALHLNAGAVELMGEALFLQNRILRAADAAADRALGEAIRSALEDGAPAAISAPSALGAVVIQVAAMRADDDDPFQTLRAVALLRADEPRH